MHQSLPTIKCYLCYFSNATHKVPVEHSTWIHVSLLVDTISQFSLVVFGVGFQLLVATATAADTTFSATTAATTATMVGHTRIGPIL